MGPLPPMKAASGRRTATGGLGATLVVSALLLAGLVGSGILDASRPATFSLASTAIADWMNVTSSSSTVPPLDLWASLVYDPSQKDLVLFGGCRVGVCPVAAQTWTFEHGRWTNVTSDSPQPPARGYASMAYDSTDSYTVLFGGGGQSSVLGDTWTYANHHWTNVTARSAPSPRGGASMAYDPALQGIVLYGGLSATEAILNDTWFFTNGSWSRLLPAMSPPPRYEASMVWDGVDSELVLVEGCGVSVCPLNDSWRYAAGTWSPLPQGSGASPPARYLEALTFDASRGVVRLFGGLGAAVSLGDTWEYARGQWTQVFPTKPPRAREGSAAPESTEGWLSNGTLSVLPYAPLWGGDWISCAGCPLRGLEDTWVFESPPQPTVIPSGSTVAGGAMRFGAAITGGTPPFTYTWKFGDGSTGVGPNVTHTFATAYPYSVTLGVQDDAGVLVTTTYQLSVLPQNAVVPAAILGILVVAGAVVAAVLVRWVGRRRRRPPS